MEAENLETDSHKPILAEPLERVYIPLAVCILQFEDNRL